MAGRQLPDRNQGRTTIGPARTRFSQQGLTAASIAAVAFWCYYATLLPGLDLGDSASFQTGIGTLTLTPRQGYPLYYALGNVFGLLHPGEPARALNLASAVFGALAAGLTTYLGARLSGSTIGGVGAGLFLAFSYTFWTQAITAEVYTLHILLLCGAMVALLAWCDQPTPGRLGVFYAIFALGFGNHLSMVLMIPAFAAVLLMHGRLGSHHPMAPRMIAMAAGIAAAGALQYVWNFRGLWDLPEPPTSLAEAILAFWADVTKSDWRASLVNTVSERGLQSRPAMYWFDLRQQVGVVGVALAAVGLVYVAVRSPRRAVLLLLMYAANLAFAWTYNVGDAYIFFLPSHYVVALCAGAGVAAVAGTAAKILRSAPRAAAIGAWALLLYPAWRGYDTFPAVDRSWDRRAEQLLDAFTSRDNAIYAVDTNWQVQNAFQYFMRERKPHLPWFATEELAWLDGNHGDRFRHLVEANREIGRDVVISPVALKNLRAVGYAIDNAHVAQANLDPAHGLLQGIASTRAGSFFVFGILRPDREFQIDDVELATAWRWLTGESIPVPDSQPFAIVVGRLGQKPLFVKASAEPYRVRLRVDRFDVDIRMESWLPTDTIRRAGFGHVIVDRQHALTLERGLSFAAFPGGEAAYGSGLFAPIPQLLLKPQLPGTIRVGLRAIVE